MSNAAAGVCKSSELKVINSWDVMMLNILSSVLISVVLLESWHIDRVTSLHE